MGFHINHIFDAASIQDMKKKTTHAFLHSPTQISQSCSSQSSPMSAVYDNWERLVAATLRREWDRYLARCDSLSSASYSSASASASFRSEASDSFSGYSFTYRQLLQATDGFNSVNLLNRGQSGDFFRGYIRDKQILPQGSVNTVIKVVDLRLEGNRKAYSSELNMLNTVPDASRFSPFLGLCWENEKIYMVYKYASKRDLARLYRQVPDLDWKTKLKIAIGAAERLVYLHDECTPSLAHGDVQASSILVDDQFDVWLGSWSKVCTGNRNLTCPYDVYCFGKLLLHLVEGSLGVGSLAGETKKEEIEELLHNQEQEDLQFSLSTILYNMKMTEREEYMDRLDGLTYLLKPHHYDYKHLNNIGMGALLKEEEDFVEEIWAVAFIAQACLNPISSKRPQMRKVLYHLKTPKAKNIGRFG